MPGTYDLILTTMDGKKDAVVCVFPSVPDRSRLNAAYRKALGYTRPEDDTVNPDLVNYDDLIAVCWAAIGLSWKGPPLPELPTFRECGRDVVAYGEAVASSLYFAGYGDAQEQIDAGRDLYRAIIRGMMEGAKAADAGFPTAPPGTSKPAEP